MPITTIPLGNKPFVTPYTSVGREVCKNLYLEYSNSGTAKAEYFAIRIPGMNIASEWYAGESRARGLHTGTDGNLYIVQRNRFARIDVEGHGHQLGTLNTISTNPVSMCDNGSELLIVDGRDGWIYSFELGTFERVTDTAFPGVVSQIGSKHCVCIDGYFFVLDPGTTHYQWSQPFYIESGGEYWNGLDFGQKQATPEPILTIASCQGLLWLFGARSIEVHYNTGDFANGLWQRQQGAIMQMGCAAEWSVAVFASNVFWLGADGTGAVGVWTNDGFQPRRISTRGIEQIFQTLGDLSTTVGFVYSHNGHTFYVLQLPGRCFVYDATTDAWHQRTYLSPVTGAESSWRGWLHAYAYGKNIVGQIDGGGLCWIDQSAHRNRDPLNFTYDYIRWEKTSPITFAQGKLVSYWSAQPIFQQGVGLSVALDPATGQPATYPSGNTSGNTGTYTDSRDGKVYRTVLMPDGKWWFAENYAWAGAGKCYNNDPDLGAIYGRIYTWTEANANLPSGTHLESSLGWQYLFDEIPYPEGKKLKANSSLWDVNTGTDDYGFAALPGGNAEYLLGEYATFWTSTDEGGYDGYQVVMTGSSDYVGIANQSIPSYNSVRYVVDSGNVPDPTTTPAFGSNPVCRLSWSNDSGASYGNEHELEIGALGEYGKRSRKVVCGHGRNRVWKITGSDPVETILVSLLVDAEVMGS